MRHLAPICSGWMRQARRPHGPGITGVTTKTAGLIVLASAFGDGAPFLVWPLAIAAGQAPLKVMLSVNMQLAQMQPQLLRMPPIVTMDLKNRHKTATCSTIVAIPTIMNGVKKSLGSVHPRHHKLLGCGH